MLKIGGMSISRSPTWHRCPALVQRKGQESVVQGWPWGAQSFVTAMTLHAACQVPLPQGLPAASGQGHCQVRPQDLVITGVTTAKLIFLFLWGRQSWKEGYPVPAGQFLSSLYIISLAIPHFKGLPSKCSLYAIKAVISHLIVSKLPSEGINSCGNEVQSKHFS